MDLDELLAREQIRELIASYTHLGDGGRIAEMIELFEPEAELDAFGEPLVGHVRIAGFFQGIADGSSPGPKRTFIRHYISNVTIGFDSPTEAHGSSYWSVISDSGLESSGRYRDTYRRTGDTWRFRTRRIRRDGVKSS